ncbi:hypothetical protein PMV_371 [Port-miou virus]|uniref:Uncharacterized protein n=1 Tax=Port-miou virus TaxID=1733873 RepID=A0A0N9P759_9VIRU|nr:hypothetical protein PMV_371 [Port-miou virus]
MDKVSHRKMIRTECLFFIFEMDYSTIQDLIDQLTAAKEQHGNIPVVVNVVYSGNHWLEPIRKLTVTSSVLPSANGDQDTAVLLLEE